MTAAFFLGEESAYAQWLVDNPQGWVLNTHKIPNRRYLVLHRAHCHTISECRQHAGKPAFTGGQYAKVRADKLDALLGWVKQQGFDTFTDYCSACKTNKDALLAAALSPQLVAPGTAESPGQDDAWRELVVRVRQGQSKFRTKLLDAYGGRCAVTGTKLPLLLEAAHIAPHATGTNYHVTNGLLLRADIHTLYDLNYLSVDPSGQVHLLRELLATEYADLHGRTIVRPVDEALQPSTDALKARHGRYSDAEARRISAPGASK